MLTLATVHSGPELALLTRRQKDVLLLVCDGLSNKEIAARLRVSLKTVEFHKALVLDKLQVRTTAHLVRYAVRNGIIKA